MINVALGINLKKDSLIQEAGKWNRRDCFRQLGEFLYDARPHERVFILYGLRRTGKSTLMRQAIAGMSEECLSKTAYISIRPKIDTMVTLDEQLYDLKDKGYRYIFIDEVTFMPDFIECASIFSDIYAANHNMKIVLSGTDSLSFYFALGDKLFDRADAIHTTHIPFHEWSRIMKNSDLDTYLQYGGVLLEGGISLNREKENVSALDAHMRTYFDTSIPSNLQHSLEYHNEGTSDFMLGEFVKLKELYLLRGLYKANELTNIINRAVQDALHSFLLSKMNKDFKSSDYGSMRELVFKNNSLHSQYRKFVSSINIATVIQKVKDALEILNKNERQVPLDDKHLTLIKTYLQAMDVVASCPTSLIYPNKVIDGEHMVVIQPALRYAQTRVLLESLKNDLGFSSGTSLERDFIVDTIRNDVRGRILEDVVLYETFTLLAAYDVDIDGHPRYDVRQLDFFRADNNQSGQIDMCIYDRREHNCTLIEIKHSDQSTPDQFKHMIDPDKCARIEQNFGPIIERCVLYCGENSIGANGIIYKNAVEYLEALTNPIIFETPIRLWEDRQKILDTYDAFKDITPGTEKAKALEATFWIEHWTPGHERDEFNYYVSSWLSERGVTMTQEELDSCDLLCERKKRKQQTQTISSSSQDNISKKQDDDHDDGSGNFSMPPY